MADDRARVRLRIHGRVQGVMFRASAADEARILGISGDARNLADGAVEIVAEGRRRDLESLIAWAHRGPELARVTQVDEEWQEFTGEIRQLHGPLGDLGPFVSGRGRLSFNSITDCSSFRLYIQGNLTNRLVE